MNRSNALTLCAPGEVVLYHCAIRTTDISFSCPIFAFSSHTVPASSGTMANA